MCEGCVLQRLQIKPGLNIVKWAIAIDCELKMNSGRTVYYCKKTLRQRKNVKIRLEMKWMRILIICHMMIEGTEKFHFFKAWFILSSVVWSLRSIFSASNWQRRFRYWTLFVLMNHTFEHGFWNMCTLQRKTILGTNRKMKN